jgi:hypothetical protein
LGQKGAGLTIHGDGSQAHEVGERVAVQQQAAAQLLDAAALLAQLAQHLPHGPSSQRVSPRQKRVHGCKGVVLQTPLASCRARQPC